MSRQYRLFIDTVGSPVTSKDFSDLDEAVKRAGELEAKGLDHHGTICWIVNKDTDERIKRTWDNVTTTVEG